MFKKRKDLLIISVGVAAAIFFGSLLFGIIAESETSFNSTDPFELGQHYFNYGNEIKGEYDLKKARTYFEQAIAEDPQSNQLVWYQLGRIDFLEGDFNAAIYKFKKQIQYFDDSVPNVHYMLGLTYGYRARSTGSTEDWEMAEESFKEYLVHDPESPWAITDLSWVYFSQGKFEEMLPLLEEGLEIRPDNPWLLNMYGLALMNKGNDERAKEVFLKTKKEAEKLTPEDWGQSYPGNDPKSWKQGLLEFQSVIETNLSLLNN